MTKVFRIEGVILVGVIFYVSWKLKNKSLKVLCKNHTCKIGGYSNICWCYILFVFYVWMLIQYVVYILDCLI